jgi:hypothetical protein
MGKYVGVRPPVNNAKPAAPSANMLTRFDFVEGGSYNRVLMTKDVDENGYIVCIVRYHMPESCDGSHCIKRHSPVTWPHGMTCSKVLGVRSFAQSDDTLYYLHARISVPSSWVFTSARVGRATTGFGYLHIPGSIRNTPLPVDPGRAS